jgi:hypothetical protein
MNIQENIITDYLLNMKLIDILGKYKLAHPTLSIYLIRKILIDNNITNRGRYSKYKALINNEPQPITPLINAVIPNNSKQSQSKPTNTKQTQSTPNKINSITDADVDAIIKPVKKPRQPRQPRQPNQNIKSIDTDNVFKIDEINKVNLVCFPKSQELILKSKQIRANRKK